MNVRTNVHRRRSIRLHGYDYAQAGSYFVTICTKDRACLFGEIVDCVVRLNDCGVIVERVWTSIPKHFPRVVIDEFVVMPNHVHGVLTVISIDDGRGTACRAPAQERFGRPTPATIPTIVRSIKSAATKEINELRGTPGGAVWQRNYYEHIIRNDDSLNRIRQYIRDNPAHWVLDQENPNSTVPRDESVGARHAVPIPASTIGGT